MVRFAFVCFLVSADSFFASTFFAAFFLPTALFVNTQSAAIIRSSFALFPVAHNHCFPCPIIVRIAHQSFHTPWILLVAPLVVLAQVRPLLPRLGSSCAFFLLLSS
jgi:hypothetical protein